MKRFFTILLFIVLLLPSINIVHANPSQPDVQIVATEDGGYIVIELYNSSNIARATLTKTRSYTRYDVDNNALWKASITGSFTYDGRTASCTSSSCNVTIYDSAWYTISKTAWTSENFAKATVEMGQKMLGVTVRRETYDLSILCDRYGNVS